MSLEATGCLPELDPCDYSKGLYSQFSGKPRMKQIFCCVTDLLVCDANSTSACGKVSCETATGELLTLYGQQAGFPRTHCSVKATEAIFGLRCDDPLPPAGTGCPDTQVVGLCEGAYFYCALSEREDYVFTDDDFYRSFIKAAFIKRRLTRTGTVPNYETVCEQIQALWGPDAWVVYAQDGSFGVSAGRDLTQEEICLLGIYAKVICVGIGIKLDIFCVAPFKPIGCNRTPEFIKTNIACNNPPTNSAPTFIKTEIECNNP